jgi:GntR family transcriptional regulator/MocR family aminotransferase
MRSPGWADLFGWQVDRGDGTPLFRQIALQVRGAVLAGALRPGTRLPSSRAMASQLGVVRASVVAAYEQLLAEGAVECRPGAGTFVCADLAALPGPRRRGGALPTRPRIPAPAHAFGDFERAAASTEERPFNTGRTLIDARTAEIWRRLTHRAVRSLGAADLGYSDPRGLIALRQGICDYLQAARAVRCDPRQIVVTAGTQHAIDIAIRVLLAPGDEVWVEDPGYPLTHDQLLLAKVRPRPIPVDAHGIVVQAGMRAAPHARAAFVTPSHQFPTGVALSMARRLELLSWARRSGAFIVEDDYTSEFRYSGPPLASLQGLDEDERVIYVGTLNKALFPGLRIGYAVGRMRCFRLSPARAISSTGSRRRSARRWPPSSSSRGISPPISGGCGSCTASSATRSPPR